MTSEVVLRGTQNDLRGRFRGVLFACPVCFRVEESATTDGALAAVLVLAGVTVVVLGVFARFIAGFVQRERGQPGDPEC